MVITPDGSGKGNLMAIGLISGWAASRTRSIWPSLASGTVYNLVMCVLFI